ncbi:hypothetical protein NQ314_019547, partial [Rhamnusium bicolor]
MIELTVKTLDSQNHQFAVEDDITVEQFKAKIAETVNIPPETQRIIYCGRVLQDSSKLADYDYILMRPTSRSASPQPQRRGFRGFRGLEQGNAMYLGSMAFPGNLMESQGIVPPPPTHSLSASRLNVAGRMLRRAEAVIRLLENPSTRPQEQSPPEENQEEEVTPVIEARVIVPANNSEPIDEAMVLNAVQNSLIHATTGPLPLGGSTSGASGSGTQSTTESAQRSPNLSGTSTPGGTTPRSSSTENLASESRSESNNGLPENASRTSEMAELLTVLGQLQTRFAPFLERYQNFMQEDPEIPPENQAHTQVMLNRVSEVLHFLGHAYHSLSDIIIRVRTPPPRPLLCRPILIQHSAVVQTGIPIQVEAQINLSADRPPANANQTSTATTEGTATTTATSNTTSNSASGGPTFSVQPGFVGLPFLPGTAMRVQSFPVEIRAMRSATATPRPQNNNNNTVNTSEGVTGTPPSTNGNSNGNGNTTSSTAGSNNTQESGQGGSFNFNNPNVEFFMEVTPEGITIDSLETTLVGSNQANDLLRGALNGPPPEFLQSLMQMAGQIINRNVTTTSTTASSTTTSTDSTQATQSNATQAAPTTAGQNSQARGNTQTNPTTATYTRSTPRPHVHLAQQAMQGGFDPFLPCNSHHISRRRLFASNATAPPAPVNQQTPTQTNSARQETPTATRGTTANGGQNQNIMNFINGIFDTIRTEYRRASEPSAQTATASNTSSAPTTSQSTNSSSQSLPNLPPDLFTLNSGNVEPINRNRTEIQNFFRVRICDGNTTAAGVDRGVDRLITEMQPFLENFRYLPVQDDIDMVRSAEQLFRQRLPNIINIAINLNSNSIRLLLDQCITTAQQLCALTLRASSTGQQGVEIVFEQIMNRFMAGVPQHIQNWTLMTSLVHLRQVISNLSVPESILQPYIVRQSEAALPSVINRCDVGDNSSVVQNSAPVQQAEAMELDGQDIVTTNNELGTNIMLEDTEPLPNIVLGSEPWHGQVPEDWVPIIARDAQKQRRQNSQGPFSDAYLSGMPSKRRKIVNSSKPQGSLPQVITESVRQAVTATGLSSAAPVETVAQAAGASPEIQAAYRNLLRSSVQASLRDNEDFTPDRFPNASNYFKNTQAITCSVEDRFIKADSGNLPEVDIFMVMEYFNNSRDYISAEMRGVKME